MATKTTGNLIPSAVNTPLDARARVATLADVANMQNPELGGIFYCIETGRHYKITALTSKTIGAIDVENAAVDTYEALPDAAALEDTFAVIQNLTENHSLEIGFDNAPLETTSEVTDDDGNTVYEEDGTTPKTETERAFQCFVVGSNNKYGSSVTIHGDNNENSLGFVRIYGSEHLGRQQRAHGVRKRYSVRKLEQGQRQECKRRVYYRQSE